MLKEIVVKVYPLTTKVKGVLYINRRRIRGVIPLRFIKRIKELIGVYILLLRFSKLIFEISLGIFRLAKLYKIIY